MRRAFLTVFPGGRIVEIGARAVVGRGADCDARVESDAVSRRHAEVVRTAEGFVINDLGSTAGTWLSSESNWRWKAPRGQPLADEDRIVFSEASVVFTLDTPLQLEPGARRFGPLELALSANPDDDSLWRVYGDALLERGDRFGPRIATQSTTWPALDGNLRDVPSLHVTWRSGYLREATLGVTPRLLRFAHVTRGFTHVLRQLLAAPIARFLVSLHLDLPPAVFDAVAAELFALLADVEHPTLRRLTFGPYFEGEGSARIPERPLRGPHLGPSERLCYGAAWLEREGRREALDRGRVVQLAGPGEIGVELSYTAQRWRIVCTSTSLEGSIRINEHVAYFNSMDSAYHLLRPGDVLEIGGSILRFGAEQR